MKVVPICIEAGVNITTSSYISPEMLALDAAAKAKGVIMVNECGLDPGIDIMGTMKVVNEAKKHNFKVVSYESYCGGIPTAEQATNPLGYKFSWNPGAGIRASRNTAIYMENGKKVTCTEPLKVAKDVEDVSVAMKFEVYPNRDSTVFMDRFGMTDCETFIRGTFRYKGFSTIVSAFHDIGITSDDACDAGVKTLRDLVTWRLTKVAEQELSASQKALIAKMSTGMAPKDKALTEGVLARTDVKRFGDDLKQTEEGYSRLLKAMRFLGFFEDDLMLTIKDGKGNLRPCLDCFGDVMAVRMEHTKNDRDLVVMRHNFILENEKKERWNHTSTWIQSGQSAASGGQSLMSTSVGVTCGITSRLVLEGRITTPGVLSPTTPEMYEPILEILEKKFGIAMIEDSERPDGLPVTGPKAKL